MNMNQNIINTPWDARALGCNTFEILYTSDTELKETLEEIFRQKSCGHYTIKINPLASKKYYMNSDFIIVIR